MIYTITSTLPKNHGGRTKALLKRIQLLQDELGIKQTILTTNYNANYPGVYKTFRKRGILDSETQILNIYEWLSGYQLFDIPESTFRKKKIYKTQNLPVSNVFCHYDKKLHAEVYYSKNDDNKVLHRQFYKHSQVVKYDDLFVPEVEHRIKRDEYNRYGYLHKTTYFSYRSGKRIQEKLYDLKGQMYCQKFFEDNDKNNAINITTYENGQLKHAFKSDKALFEYFYNHIFEDGDIVFNDARALDRPLLMTDKKIKSIIVFHSAHLNEGKIKGSYKLALSTHEKTAQYIVLTKSQKKDILQETNIPEDKITVIPHFIEPSISKVSESTQNQFVYMGRFSPEKQVPQIIEAFHLFKQIGYSTRLKLYGADIGEEKTKVMDLIEKYHLQDDVDVESFTHSPAEVFHESLASLLTSNREGFGMTVMESINEGCPVISYDIRYGPDEIIEEGVNGYLVEQNDIKTLAETMAKMVEHPLKNVETKAALKPEAAKQHFQKLFRKLKY